MLASFAGDPAAAQALVGLLLDVQDTAVTRRTAKALVRAGTAVPVQVLARAVAGAGDSHGDWILAGVHDALAGSTGMANFLALCEGLAHDAEAAVRQGGAKLLEWSQSTGG
ncbi:hypothetical protein [Streptomyces sp. NPDC048442]|uniref:hypothetical protein n=1 Tax=Streptomyces sp. NPDC048442 TaxID=3154823 RepID=UPI00343F9512